MSASRSLEPMADVNSSNPTSKEWVEVQTPDEVHLEAVLADWSGRGAHVDFENIEQVPLVQGRFLGHGSMGSVFETNIRGHAFAWKQRFCRRRIGEAERKEIEILKKVSHHHIIKLVGSYTHRQFLGLLLYPVAVCDLATFFEDVEALFHHNEYSDRLRQERFEALGLKFDKMEWDHASDVSIWHDSRAFIQSRMGCIISAVEYLHNQRIRHKDLKPSNILLSADNLWLTDFGTATDFSDLTVSTTDNCERGTAKYFAPEMAAFEKCGRSADIFSLGCVLFEIYTLNYEQTLLVRKKLRQHHDKSFQSNLDKIIRWLSKSWSWNSLFDSYIRDQIRKMLARNPAKRPKIGDIKTAFTLLENSKNQSGQFPLFNRCCKAVVMSGEEYDRHIKYAIRSGADEARTAMSQELEKLRIERDNLQGHIADLEVKLDQQVQSLNAWEPRDALRLEEQCPTQASTNNSGEVSLRDFVLDLSGDPFCLGKQGPNQASTNNSGEIPTFRFYGPDTEYYVPDTK